MSRASEGRSTTTIHLSQMAYIDTILDRFNMATARPVITPWVAGVHLQPDGEPCHEGVARYQQLVGSLMWAAMATRPDVTFTVSALARHCSAPTQEHWEMGIRALKYLKGTRTLGLELGGRKRAPVLEAWSDADHTGDLSDRKSTSGFIVKFRGSTVSWATQKQKSRALSTAEAEYYALTETWKDVEWVKKALMEYGVESTERVMIWCDNQSAIALVENPAHHHSTKHIDIYWHQIRDVKKSGRYDLEYVRTDDQLADIFTKGLAGPAHERHREGLGVTDSKAEDSRIEPSKRQVREASSREILGCVACTSSLSGNLLKTLKPPRSPRV